MGPHSGPSATRRGSEGVVRNFRLNPSCRRTDGEEVPDHLVLSPDTLRLLQHAAVIADAAGQLDTSAGWERDELLDTIEMHAGAMRVAVGAYR